MYLVAIMVYWISILMICIHLIQKLTVGILLNLMANRQHQGDDKWELLKVHVYFYLVVLGEFVCLFVC